MCADAWREGWRRLSGFPEILVWCLIDTFSLFFSVLFGAHYTSVHRCHGWTTRKRAEYVDKVIKKVLVLTVFWIWICNQLMSTRKHEEEKATPAELKRSETHTQTAKKYAESLNAGLGQSSKCVSDSTCEFKVRIARNPCSHGAEIWVSPSLLPSFPPSLFLTVFWKPWSLPLPSIHLQGHGNHSLPPSSFPPSHTLLLPHFCLLPLLCLMLLF